jgi:RHS repeat-associated protein
MYDSPQVEREHIHRLHQREGVLSCSKARYYNPSVGRFVSEDPLRIKVGGDANLYSYVTNKPAKFNDPSGLITPLSVEEEAKCRGDIALALSIVKKQAEKNKPCTDCFEKYGCILSELLKLSERKIKFGTPAGCASKEAGNTGGYTRYPNKDNAVYICPYSCRMGVWQIAFTISHELMHLCRFRVKDIGEDIPNEAAIACIGVPMYMEEVTVVGAN